MGKNLFYKSSSSIIKAYCGTIGADFIVNANNSTQSTLVIPITAEMRGKTLRMSCDEGDDVTNRWICGQVNSFPTSGSQTYPAGSTLFTAGAQINDHERYYADTIRVIGDFNYILFFFSNDVADLSKFVNSLMICDDETYYPYREGVSPEHEVKTVIGSALQSFSDNEKERARNNIGLSWNKVQNYTPLPTTPETSKRVTQVGPFDIRYYADSQSALRLVIENMDIGDPHSISVCYNTSGAIETFSSLYFGDPQILNVEFSNSTKWFNNIRLIVDNSAVYDVSLQELSLNPNRYLFYKVNG